MRGEFATKLILINEWIEEFGAECEMCPCWIDSNSCNEEKCDETWKEWLLV